MTKKFAIISVIITCITLVSIILAIANQWSSPYWIIAVTSLVTLAGLVTSWLFWKICRLIMEVKRYGPVISGRYGKLLWIFICLFLIYNIYGLTARLLSGTDELPKYFSPTIIFIFIFLIYVSFALTRASEIMKGRFNIIDFLTLKARDEREQQIINESSRKSLAITRLLMFIIFSMLISGLLPMIKLDTRTAAYLILAIDIVAELIFRFSLKKVSGI